MKTLMALAVRVFFFLPSIGNFPSHFFKGWINSQLNKDGAKIKKVSLAEAQRTQRVLVLEQRSPRSLRLCEEKSIL